VFVDNAVELRKVFFPPRALCVYCRKAGATVRLVLGRRDYLTVETPEIKSVPPFASLAGCPRFAVPAVCEL
jgi:hypothetical protein